MTQQSFQAHVFEALQSGRVTKLVAEGQEYAIGTLPDAPDDYVYLYDTKDGSKLRVPVGDRQYMLAKMRPVKKGERAVWRKVGNTTRVFQTAPSGVIPAYSETPVVATARRDELATPLDSKALPKRRRRGARGARRKSIG
jgi:hypothetical protein